jgi:hypothetical protein
MSNQLVTLRELHENSISVLDCAFLLLGCGPCGCASLLAMEQAGSWLVYLHMHLSKPFLKVKVQNKGVGSWVQ